ncbi:MAG TPA: FGGY family carbohydrate kinase, partial [Pseudonocardiaceae bacterium]
MSLVLGVDSSTQSTKVVVVDAETGAITHAGRAPHPDGTEVDPAAWLAAFGTATAELPDGGDGSAGVAALSVAGQQHGMVALDEAGAVVRPALLWNDNRSAPQAAALTAAAGAAWWAEHTGSVPVASFTVTKLAWLAEHEPGAAARVTGVLLPHDWLSWRLAAPGTELFTDRGDASGTGYFSPAAGTWLPDVLASAFGRPLALPRVLPPSATGGATPAGVPIAAGTGDNAAAALGLGVRPGDVVVSLGTSGTVFASVSAPTADASGIVAGFCDAAGGFLPLVCTLNAARVLTAAAGLLGVDLDALSRLALTAPPGAGGLVLLPYLDGERTPNLPEATGSLGGITRANLTAANLARAAVEGMLCGLADGVDALRAHGVPVRRVLLIGGAAASPAVRE